MSIHQEIWRKVSYFLTLAAFFVWLGGFACIPSLRAQIVTIDGITQLSANLAHACALRMNGEVYCWGNNTSGKLGNGTVIDSFWPVPIPVTALGSGNLKVVVGRAHACVLTGVGGVRCWGDNSSGQLGDGTYTPRKLPNLIPGLQTGVIDVVAGHSHTCALTSLGGVLCWGDNSSGAIGDGGALNSRPTPVAVAGLNDSTVSVGAGFLHSCAVRSNGEALCWGGNVFGQLGDGTNNMRLTPVAVSGLSGAMSISSSHSHHTCALISGGEVKCWGLNLNGQLGDGTKIARNLPAAVIGLSGQVSSLSTGGDSSCALIVDGTVQCWGSNNEGQLGDGTTVDRSTPTNVVGVENAVGISVGAFVACATGEDSLALCWGRNLFGTLGEGTSSRRVAPVLTPNVISAITSGARHSCGLGKNGELLCWGDNSRGQLGDGTMLPRFSAIEVVGMGDEVSSVHAGGRHTCARIASGAAKCWGENSRGQLGNGTLNDSTVPIGVLGLDSGVVSISAGASHTCAIVGSGAAKCWGENGGRLGNGSTVSSNIPVDVDGLGGGVVAISAGREHTCALTSIGSVKCWGVNSNGQVGDATTFLRLVPVSVVGLDSGVSGISAGEYHSCAVMSLGGIKCWGNNSLGALGDGSTLSRNVPVDVAGLAHAATLVDAGSFNTCALLTTGTISCWGDATLGVIGNGSQSLASRLLPTAVAGVSGGATHVDVGGSHACAIVDNSSRCWGWHQHGQLGIGGRNWAIPSTVLKHSSVPSLSLLIEEVYSPDRNGIEKAYRVTASNLGTTLVEDIRLIVNFFGGLSNYTWECSGVMGCLPQSGDSEVDVAVNLEPGEGFHVDIVGSLASGAPYVSLLAEVSGGGFVSADSIDDPVNNIGILKHGFER